MFTLLRISLYNREKLLTDSLNITSTEWKVCEVLKFMKSTKHILHQPHVTKFYCLHRIMRLAE